MANSDSSVSRRGFMAAGGVAALSLTIPASRGLYAAASKVKLGIIGCGGRGSWIADLFAQHGGYNITAVHDYFQDRADGCGGKHNVPENRRFTGLSSYKKLLEHVDAVAIISPPYFHPDQAEDAVAAGKHVYIAKPIAVDAPGCLRIEAAGKKARAGKLAFLVDFQTRADPFYIEAIKRVHEGAIGRYAFGESWYHAGDPFPGHYKHLQDDPKNPENRLRAWGLDRHLSGDIITEQNIHTLDVASWIMDAEPLWACGTCARKVRTVGTCADTFSVFFQYPDHVAINFHSRQFEGYDSPDGINNRMFGNEGVLETSYGGQVLIRGKHFYRGGKSPGIYKDGAVTNIAAFHKAIMEGDFRNPTVECSVRSNLVTILGRTAAYRNEKVTWKQMLEAGEVLDAGLEGLKA